MQGGIGNSVSCVIEETPPQGAVQAKGAPDSLLERILCKKGKCAELLRYLMNEWYGAIRRRTYDLKPHHDVSGGRNLRHSIQGSRSSPYDQETRHAADKLKSDRSVFMNVVPVRPAWMSGGDVNLYMVRGARFHLPVDIIGDA
jgi:hypothetical protein